MPVFNVYKDLIVLVVESLQRERDFGGVDIHYDRSRNRLVPRERMPAINCFIDGTAEDVGYGSSLHSIQSRSLRIPLSFGVWAVGGEPGSLDEVLWELTGRLTDWMRSNTELNPTRGWHVDVRSAIRIDTDYSGDETNIVGSNKVSVDFIGYTGPGPA